MKPHFRELSREGLPSEVHLAMKPVGTRTGTRFVSSLLILLGLAGGGCGLFDTRDPEPPDQGGLDYVPATVPSIALSNLVSAIAQKNVDNYMRNFGDPAVTGRPFVFIPSAEASTVYPSVREWTYANEREYFQNLVAKADGFSSLVLTPRDSIIGPSEAIYNFDYVLSFEHTDAVTFPTTASGNLQFVLAPDPTNIWSIFSWSDFSTSPDITWSSFKGQFGN